MHCSKQRFHNRKQHTDIYISSIWHDLTGWAGAKPIATSTHFCSSPPVPLPCSFLTALGVKEIIHILMLFAAGRPVPGPNAQLMNGGSAFVLSWLRGPCDRPQPSMQTRRAWQGPSRQETWWGQEKFLSSRLFCTLTLNQSDSFDLGQVSLIYLAVVGSRIQPNKLYPFYGVCVWEEGKAGPSVPRATLGADCQGVFFIVCTACLMIGTKLRRGSFLTGHWATRMC